MANVDGVCDEPGSDERRQNDESPVEQKYDERKAKDSTGDKEESVHFGCSGSR